jgi:Mg-chelatase subunit ChlD
MRLHSILRASATVAALAAASGSAEANFLFPSVDTSNPTNAEANVNRQVGRKGLLYRFRFTDDAFNDIAGGFPLNLTMATVTLKVGADPTLTCTAGSSPSSGQCSFRNVDGETADGQLDYVEFLYNGDFPASTTIQYAVSGAKAADGVTNQDGATPNTVSFTTGNAAPRQTASMELVFDVSGSMGWPAVPAGPVTRMDALKSAAQVFFTALADHAILGDKVGSVFFSNAATVFDPTPGGTNLEPAHDDSKVTLIKNDLQARIPGGSTSIGAGLQAGNASGFAADPAPNMRKYALLFSDGEQNTAPNVDVVGNALQVGGVNYPADITVCPITAGRMTAPGFTLQQSIADAVCGGRNAHIRDAEQTFVQGDLETFFAQALADVLVGDKLEMVADLTGTIQQGQVRSHAFRANPQDVALSVSLSWSGKREGDRVVFQLQAPDGTVVDLGTRLRFGRNLAFVTLRFPLRQGGAVIAPAGQWQVRVLAPNLTTPQVSYHLMVLLDNETLASEFSASVSDPGTGDPIPVRVKLTEGGSPIAGASVAAAVFGPRDGLGDILSTSSHPGAPGVADTGANPGANAKLAGLLGDPDSAALFAGRTLPTVTLADDGTGGDATAGDGIYSGVFRGADEEGHYHFRFEVQGSAATNGDFQRTRRLSVFVRPKPDPGLTDLFIVSRTAAPGGAVDVRLRAIPRDRFSNFVGPGYLGRLRIASSEGSVVTPLADRLDGSYEIVHRLPSATSNPDITLEVLGEPVIREPLDALPTGPRRRPYLSLHLGLTSPFGSFGNAAEGSISLGLDLELPLTSSLSVEAYLGHDRFSAVSGGDDPAFTLLSARGRWRSGGSPFRASIFAGAGPYLDRDGDLSFGVESGGAVEYWFTPKAALEGSYTFRTVGAGDFEYGVVQIGGRFRF